MKTMTVTEVKKNFSKVLAEVEGGETIAIISGRTKIIRAYLVPYQSKKSGATKEKKSS